MKIDSVFVKIESPEPAKFDESETLQAFSQAVSLAVNNKEMESGTTANKAIGWRHFLD